MEQIPSKLGGHPIQPLVVVVVYSLPQSFHVPLIKFTFTFSQCQKKKNSFNHGQNPMFSFSICKSGNEKNMFFPPSISQTSIFYKFSPQFFSIIIINHHFDSNIFRVGFMLLTLLSSTTHRLCIGTCVIQIALRVCCLMLVILIWF
jgi:hypothetical protein